MPLSIREIQEGEQEIGVGEAIPFVLDVSPLTTNVATGATGVVLRERDNTSVTPTMMPTNAGLPISGGTAIYFTVTSASANERYRVAIQFSTVTGSGTFVPYMFLRGTP